MSARRSTAMIQLAGNTNMRGFMPRLPGRPDRINLSRRLRWSWCRPGWSVGKPDPRIFEAFADDLAGSVGAGVRCDTVLLIKVRGTPVGRVSVEQVRSGAARPVLPTWPAVDKAVRQGATKVVIAGQWYRRAVDQQLHIACRERGWQHTANGNRTRSGPEFFRAER